jgi:uncharacterized protein
LKKNIESLIQLQVIDKKLNEIEMLRGDLPKQVEALQSEGEELKGEIETDKKSIHDFTTERHSLDTDLISNKERIGKYNDQLYKATSNKEYEATSSQIEYCEQELKRIQARINEIEYKTLELEEALKPKEEKLQALMEDFQQRQAELNVKIAETAKEENELKDQRGHFLPGIRKDILNKYERIRKAKNNMAVSPIVKESCGGCFNQVPPQVIIELRKKDAIRTCEYCGRILYVPDAVEALNAVL